MSKPWQKVRIVTYHPGGWRTLECGHSEPFGGNWHIGGENYQACEKCHFKHLKELESEMCRALLAGEWKRMSDYGWCCPFCGAIAANTKFTHIADCIGDSALSKAGLPDQASRDAAREELGMI